MWIDLREIIRLPQATIDLMYGKTAQNHEFYRHLVEELYQRTRQRHRRLLVVRNWQYGVALRRLPGSFDDYFMCIEASARRNYKKAQRCGYRFEKIDYNAYLQDIREIRGSTDVRQGRLPMGFVAGEVKPCNNPDTLTNVHDYPYFGILRGEKLYAYGGCFICGELGMIEHMLGHAAYQSDGIVPMLIIDMAGYILENYPHVKYYGYDTYFGASATMRRFKKKFEFLPYRVKWVL